VRSNKAVIDKTYFWPNINMGTKSIEECHGRLAYPACFSNILDLLALMADNCGILDEAKY